MKTSEIQNKIDEIRAEDEAGFHDVAHDLEDRLMVEFINYVAERTDELGDQARLIVRSTSETNYPRWFA